MSVNNELATRLGTTCFKDLAHLQAGFAKNPDVLLLLADRFDLGELRFIDQGRNLIVASQDRLPNHRLK
jgi:hypothetical protein